MTMIILPLFFLTYAGGLYITTFNYFVLFLVVLE